MNLYFLFLSVYALLITPISIHWSLRLGKRLGYRIRLQAAGFPFIKKRKPNDNDQEQLIEQSDVAQSLAKADITVLKAVLDKKVRQRFFHSIHLTSLHLQARISMQDACATALCFSAATTLLETLALLKRLPSAMTGRINADFSDQGSEVYIEGIFSARLGSLGITAILLSAAYVRARSKQSQPKEEAYAASH
ncbi:MAG: hypothetical protein GX096_01260 [Clostridiales bacterium]|nr:hypothetical protein [Clostridiales bacterium]